jgi:hypothetical protein
MSYPDLGVSMLSVVLVTGKISTGFSSSRLFLSPAFHTTRDLFAEQ